MIEANKIQQLDFNLLKVFESLYLERNMTTVANILFISPSAVSHAIKRLRLVLNDQLFVRQGQQMQPTPLCQNIAPQLIETLGKLRQILQTCGDFELKNNEYFVSDPAHGLLKYSEKEFLNNWVGNKDNNRNIEGTVLLLETTTSFFERDFPKEKSNLSISFALKYVLKYK